MSTLDFRNFDDFWAPAGFQSIILDTFGPPWALGLRSALCFSLLRIGIESFVNEICEDMSRELAMLRDSRVAEGNDAGDYLIQRQSSLANWISWLAF